MPEKYISPKPEPSEDLESPENSTSKAKLARENFVKGVMIRGEAARTENGELPPGATHEIIENEHGETTIRRKRFSAY